MKRLSFLMNKAARLTDKDLFDQIARPGTHQMRIAEIFGPRCTFEGDGPVFDGKLVILAFTNRSGSNLMSEYTRQTGRVGGVGEFLNHDIVAARAAERGITSLPDYIHDLHREYCTGGKSLGVKASWDQMAMLLRWNILQMFSDVIVLHVIRHDTVAQAVSYGIALNTKAWTSKHAASDTAFDVAPEDVARNAAGFHRANLMIRLISDAYGLKRFDVGYEQIVNAPAAHVTRVLRAAGLADADWAPRPGSLRKQADDRNAAFAERFRARLRAAVEDPQRSSRS